MTTAADNTGQVSRYTYDADGRRVRRQVASSQEEWQIYGFDGELIAEYQANASVTAPEKEYGYRNGQLLVTATGRFNVALAANGAVATASSTNSGFSTTGAINGNNRGPWGNGEGWNDNTPNSVPDWLQVDFAGSKTIDEIDVFSLHDNYTQQNTPTETQTFTLYGLLAFDVQYWNGSAWTTIPGGSVTGNNKVWRKFTFSAITTTKIRVLINQVPDSWSRIVELQAFGTSAGGEKVQWLVPDHLGTPRMIFDQTGSFASVRRHDYLPFGEELFAGAGGRTTAQGYSVGDGIRQEFTSKERDVETGLDYFGARYYQSTQGRFTSVDPENAGANPDFPQSWNAYAYAGGNPVLFSDPDGREYLVCGPNGNDGKCTTVSDEQFWADRKAFESTGNKYTGSRNFFETGQVKNADGEVVATYAQISIDDLSQRYIFAIRGAVNPIPMATAQFFGISAVLGTGGGVLYYVVAPYLAPTVTTLGLSGTGTGAAVTEGSLASLSIQQLNGIIRGTQHNLLQRLFDGGAQGAQGASRALANLRVPPGLTREALLVYAELARRAIASGKDTLGVQAIRLQIIEKALEAIK